MNWQEKFKRKDHLEFRVGDEIKIGVRIKEGDKERIQSFEGLVLSIRGEGLNKTFKVRKVTGGIGVERTFLFHSHAVATVKVLKSGRTRRAKLFYLRDKVGKGSRLKEDLTLMALPAEEPKAAAPVAAAPEAAVTADAPK
ncbi:MAG: 50S ribosomal protein L19 [Candidatus Firestonebacteria bacterium RIFOXYA2_FULL_40_8]|nr:MAG: 50S ribosomal protein L19 [Candidatus Firestonebacteria bacterium RIFOXYA2_FULL_40_8]